MPTKPKTTSEKIDLVHKEVKKHSKDIADLKVDVAGIKEQIGVIDNKQQRFEEKQDRFEERQGRFEEKQDRFEENQKRFEEKQDRFDKGQQRFEERQLKFEQDLSDFKATMRGLYDKQANEAANDREQNRRFRDEIYTMVDRVAKMFGEFNLEKLALGAKQDRIEVEIEALQDSNGKQNKALTNLETRVEYLEAKER